MTPFETLYGRPYRAFVCWYNIVDMKSEHPLILQYYTNHAQFIRDIENSSI